MKTLPYWEPGTAGVLCVAGPHAIPISSAIRAGELRIVLALGGRRETLKRLREVPAVDLVMFGPGFAFTAHARARILREALECARVAAIALEVERIQDHLIDGRTEMLAPIGWRRPAAEDERGDAAVARELQALIDAGL